MLAFQLKYPWSPILKGCSTNLVITTDIIMISWHKIFQLVSYLWPTFKDLNLEKEINRE